VFGNSIRASKLSFQHRNTHSNVAESATLEWATREVVRGDRAISADTAIRLGKYFGLPAQFWMNLQNDYDLRIAEGSGIGREIKPRNHADRAEFSASR
jgi:addiction module HigA family antidote